MYLCNKTTRTGKIHTTFMTVGALRVGGKGYGIGKNNGKLTSLEMLYFFY